MRKLEAPKASAMVGLPFLDVAHDKGIVLDGDILMVEKIKESNTRSGYCLHTSKFMIYLFKSDPLTPVLLAAIDVAMDRHPSPCILVEVDSSQTRGFNLAMSDEEQYFWMKQKKFGNLLSMTTSLAGEAPGIKKIRSGGK